MIAKDQSYIVTIKTVKFPNKYTNIIQKIVRKHGYDLDQAKRLAVNVLKLSDLYNSRKTQGNIWADSGALVAYLVYFFPLNYLRVQRALRLSSQIGYWRELRHWYEFGSGCGTAFLAYLDLALSPVDHAHFIETSPEANALMKNLLLAAHDIDLKNIQWSLHPPSQWVDNNNKYFIASYSLNEISELPKWVQQCENIFIVEPSLQKTTRHLMTLRQQLINHNYYVWAPCTHQESCPLLTHSQKDWCFDRFFIEMPDWFYKIENELPIKNRSLTYSYLAMSKHPVQSIANYGRLIGDTQVEKGKVKQAMCRNSEREFLSWLKKEGPVPTLPRGQLVYLGDVVKRGNELRCQDNSLYTFDPDKPLVL